jgi:rSAM/selenodomain-associated transferase 1
MTSRNVIRHSEFEMPSPSNHLLVFLKAPLPGQVKTRLAEEVGAETSCAIYCRLVEVLLRSLSALHAGSETGAPASDDPQIALHFTPDDASEKIRPWLQPGWALRPQGDGSLGERLERAVAGSFQRGAGKVVVIGSDCPEVTAVDIHNAFHQLEKHDVALGPATDGGYWLIGLNGPQPPLFCDMPWSTDQLLAKTLARADGLKLRVVLLRTLSDVDTLSDWRRVEPTLP